MNFWMSSAYRTRAIISRGLYIFNPLFESKKYFFKEVFSEISAFTYGYVVSKSGLQSRAGYDGARTVCT